MDPVVALALVSGSRRAARAVGYRAVIGGQAAVDLDGDSLPELIAVGAGNPDGFARLRTAVVAAAGLGPAVVGSGAPVAEA
jgi:hypothetical protein